MLKFQLDLKEQAVKYRKELVELAVEQDEKVMENYLNGKYAADGVAQFNDAIELYDNYLGESAHITDLRDSQPDVCTALSGTLHSARRKCRRIVPLRDALSSCPSLPAPYVPRWSCASNPVPSAHVSQVEVLGTVSARLQLVGAVQTLQISCCVEDIEALQNCGRGLVYRQCASQRGLDGNEGGSVRVESAVEDGSGCGDEQCSRVSVLTRIEICAKTSTNSSL